jgi:hypothetical protein
MAQMQGGLEAARKKYVKEQTAKGVSKDVAMKRFYVQTRVAELQKARKPVDATVRAQLRKNWETGNVKRAEFGAPGKPAVKKAAGPVRKGPETKSFTENPPPAVMPGTAGGGMVGKKKTSAPKRMGPETTSYTKPKPTRTGPETKSYTKPKAGPQGPKRRGIEGPGGMPGRALKPRQMPGGPTPPPDSLATVLNKKFPWGTNGGKWDSIGQKRRDYMLKYGIKGKQVYNLSAGPGAPRI